MTDPLAGMSVKEAREFVETTRACVGERPAFSVMFTNDEALKLLALAAKGAECVGAEAYYTTMSTVLSETVGGERVEFFPVAGRRVLVLKEDK